MNPGSSAVLVVYNLHRRDAGTIPGLLAASGVRHALVSRREFAELRPQSVPRHVIVLGGPQTATAMADKETLALLRRIEFHARRGGAIFGICLGAQMLARVHGAKIVRHRSGAREIGYHRIRRVGPAVACDLPEGFYYQWHYDVIENFAAGNVLMQSELAPVQAFRVGHNHVGVQFHPEVDLQTVRRLVVLFAHRLNDVGAQPALDQVAAHRRYAHQNAARLRSALVRWLAH